MLSEGVPDLRPLKKLVNLSMNVGSLSGNCAVLNFE